MHVDFLTMYANELTLSGASKDSKVLDIGKAGISEGVGYIYVRNVGAVTGLSSVALQGSSDNSTFTEILSYKLTDLTDGGGINIPIPQGLPQYTKLVFAGTSMSGKVSAGVTLRPDSPRGKRIGDYEANPNYAA
jgi:hypothetical protein